MQAAMDHEVVTCDDMLQRHQQFLHAATPEPGPSFCILSWPLALAQYGPAGDLADFLAVLCTSRQRYQAPAVQLSSCHAAWLSPYV